MINFENVSLTFADQIILDDISFSLHKKEHCGLVGRNGSGKTSLLKLIIGEIEPSKGKISFPKDYRIGYLEQHIKFTKETILEEACQGLPLEDQDKVYIAKKILFGLGFTDENINSSPESLSGGYFLRLHLAKVLISNPDCLLLDEPTNYLDITSIRWLKNFLGRWQGEFIFISHDRDFMDSVTNFTMGIHRKKLLKIRGKTFDYFEQLKLQEMVYEKTRVKAEKQIKHMQDYITRFGAKATKASQARSRQKLLDKIPLMEKLKDIGVLSFYFEESPFNGKNMLFAKNLEFSYSDKPLIHNFSCEIDKGHCIAVVGKNGYGKSTILRLLAKELLPQKGTLRMREGISIGYFGQTNINNLNENNSIEEEISSANPKLTYSEIKQISGIMMFSQDMSKKKIAVLSGGEKSRVLLGKILANPCNLLLLDEPTHHLDIESIESLIEAIEFFSGAVVIVTHSEFILKRLPIDTIILCEKSRQRVFHGDYEDFLEKIGWEDQIAESAPKNTLKEEKRLQAERVASRSKALSPLKKEISSIENEISSLEKTLHEDLILLQNEPFSADLVKKVGQDQKNLENLYSKLDLLYQQFENEKKKFESENN